MACMPSLFVNRFFFFLKKKQTVGDSVSCHGTTVNDLSTENGAKRLKGGARGLPPRLHHLFFLPSPLSPPPPSPKPHASRGRGKARKKARAPIESRSQVSSTPSAIAIRSSPAQPQPAPTDRESIPVPP